MTATITHIGTATLLIEVGGLRFLTDPVFDAPGGKYHFGWGTGSTKLTGPSVSPESLGEIDAVLLSHDHHEDNLDRAGRAFLPRARRVLTTTSGARRLGGHAEGLSNWRSTRVEGITVTATPAQHGVFLSRPFAGQTIGFMLTWQGQQHGGLYISGDTIDFPGIDRIAERFDTSVALLHLGRARFPMTGPLRFTMDARDGVRATEKLDPRTVIPIHYEGWKHFTQGRSEIEEVFRAGDMQGRLKWLTLGEPTRIDV